MKETITLKIKKDRNWFEKHILGLSEYQIIDVELSKVRIVRYSPDGSSCDMPLSCYIK